MSGSGATSAFGSLFMSRSPSPLAQQTVGCSPPTASADAAAGGVALPCPEGKSMSQPVTNTGHGSSSTDAQPPVLQASGGAPSVETPLRVPPQPTPATRMPRMTRGFDNESVCGSTATSSIGSDTSVSSLPGTPASSKQLHPSECPGGTSSSSGNGKSQPQASWWSALLPSSLEEEDTPKRSTSSSSAMALRKAQKSKKTRDSGYSDYCCFRDSHVFRGSKCEAIREDRPQTEFDHDVAVLELKSILRRYGVEPSDALVSDLLGWQAQANADGTTAMAPPGCEGGTGGPPGSARR